MTDSAADGRTNGGTDGRTQFDRRTDGRWRRESVRGKRAGKKTGGREGEAWRHTRARRESGVVHDLNRFMLCFCSFDKKQPNNEKNRKEGELVSAQSNLIGYKQGSQVLLLTLGVCCLKITV